MKYKVKCVAKLALIICVIYNLIYSTYILDEFRSVKQQSTENENNNSDNISAVETTEETVVIIPEQPQAQTSSLAVIHVGPFKTASTSIQSSSYVFHQELAKDGYLMPWMYDKKQNPKKKLKYGNQNQYNFASCFMEETSDVRKHYPCLPDLLLASVEIASHNKNLFVSAEDFSGITTIDGFEKLQRFLTPLWTNVKLVVYYRHFYSWLGSLYNNMIKKLHDAAAEHNIHKNQRKGKKYKTIESFMQEMTRMKMNHMYYTAPLTQRLHQVFFQSDDREEEIVIVNMHDNKSNPSESLFCHVLSDTKRICNAIRNQKETIHINESQDIDYIHLIYAAYDSGLIKKELTQDNEILENVKTTVEELKSIHNVRFDQTQCLKKDTLDRIWNLTIKYKRELFPGDTSNSDSTSSSLNEEHMRQEFEKAAVTTLCMIDTEKALSMTILNEKEYLKMYFKALQQR